MNIVYGEKETAYLAARDKRLGAAIAQIGHGERAADPDVVSYGDLAIRCGMRMLYHRCEIDRAAFDRCRRRYAPYGTVASLYLWAIAGGAIPELTDPAAPRGRKQVSGCRAGENMV